MILWIFALCLLGVLALIGFYQGAVRVAFSLVGLLLAAGLALPLAGLVEMILPVFGLKHPVLQVFLAPFIVFLIIVIIFKFLAFLTQKKLDTHYKYNESDTRRLLFERVNSRLGLCLGLVNGLVYLLLLSIVAYSAGYFTIQAASLDQPDRDHAALRFFNRLNRDLQSTKMDKAIAPFLPLKDVYFDGADVVGAVLHQPLLQSRLASYPPFLTLADRPEFKDLGTESFQTFWLKGPSIGELIENSKFQPVLQAEVYTNVLGLVKGDLKDLKEYMETGKSPLFDDEKILGRWDFDFQNAFTLVKRRKPNMTLTELKSWRSKLIAASKATFLATIDNKAVLRIPATNGVRVIQGTWKNNAGKYTLNVSGAGIQGAADVSIETGRLTIDVGNFPMVFQQ